MGKHVMPKETAQIVLGFSIVGPGIVHFYLVSIQIKI